MGFRDDAAIPLFLAKSSCLSVLIISGVSPTMLRLCSVYPNQTVEKLATWRLMENVHMQGFRNPEE